MMGLLALFMAYADNMDAVAEWKKEMAWKGYFYGSAKIPDDLDGTSILLVGDSFIAGWVPEQHDYLWSTMLETRCGMDVVCAAVTGSTITNGENDGYVYHGSCASYVTRELPQRDFDMILIQGGMNDWMLCEPIGTDDSRDPQTLKGALNCVLDRLEQDCPDSMIVAMSGWIGSGKTNYEGDPTEVFDQAVREVYAARNIPCLMACDPKISGIYANDAAFREKYFRTKQDSWHLNEAGHLRFFPVAATWLSECWNG